MTRVYDLSVKVGSYQKDGKEKGRYVNVGSVMEKDGKQFVLMHRTFNPAGVPNPESRDTVLISMFPVKDAAEKVQEAFDNPFADDKTPF